MFSFFYLRSKCKHSFGLGWDYIHAGNSDYINFMLCSIHKWTRTLCDGWKLCKQTTIGFRRNFKGNLICFMFCVRALADHRVPIALNREGSRGRRRDGRCRWVEKRIKEGVQEQSEQWSLRWRRKAQHEHKKFSAKLHRFYGRQQHN